MSLPFNLNSVLATASTIEGFDVIKARFPVDRPGGVITYPDAVWESLTHIADDYQDWPEDQGFGPSDMTYVSKSFIDSMIHLANLRGYYETRFDPQLRVVEYSEAEYHERMFSSEIGV